MLLSRDLVIRGFEIRGMLSCVIHVNNDWNQYFYLVIEMEQLKLSWSTVRIFRNNFVFFCDRLYLESTNLKQPLPCTIVWINQKNNGTNIETFELSLKVKRKLWHQQLPFLFLFQRWYAFHLKFDILFKNFCNDNLNNGNVEKKKSLSLKKIIFLFSLSFVNVDYNWDECILPLLTSGRCSDVIYALIHCGVQPFATCCDKSFKCGDRQMSRNNYVMKYKPYFSQIL